MYLHLTTHNVLIVNVNQTDGSIRQMEIVCTEKSICLDFEKNNLKNSKDEKLPGITVLYTFTITQIITLYSKYEIKLEHGDETSNYRLATYQLC